MDGIILEMKGRSIELSGGLLKTLILAGILILSFPAVWIISGEITDLIYPGLSSYLDPYLNPIAEELNKYWE